MLQPKAVPKSHSPLFDRAVNVVKYRAARMGLGPCRPGQSIVFPLHRTGTPEAHLIEHMPVVGMFFEALSRPAGQADCLDDPCDLIGRIVRPDKGIFDLFELFGLGIDFEQHPPGKLIVKAQTLGKLEHDLMVGLALIHRLDDLIAPLSRTVGRGHRSAGLKLRGCREDKDIILLIGQHRCFVDKRIGQYDQLQRIEGFFDLGLLRDRCDTVPHNKEGFERCPVDGIFTVFAREDS